MPRASQFIKIEGQFANSVLGTFKLIRGFATLQDLAAISAPFPMTVIPGAAYPISGHQRSIDPVHAESIKEYLQHGRPRFIPEVILSIRVECDEVYAPSQQVIGVESHNRTPGLWIGRKYKSPRVATHEIYVARSELNRIVTTERRIRRIDGNHRLHLAGQLAADPASPTKYLAPFCIVLLGPPGDRNDDFDEAMFFHTINSTALPLDSEHALQLVLGQPAEYRSSADEEFATNAALYLTRLMKVQIDAMPQLQRGKLGTTPATVLNSAATAMVGQTAGLLHDRLTMVAFSDGLAGAITEILARLPASHPEICKADYFIELASLAWGETDSTADHQTRVNQAVATLEAMARWLDRDGLHNIQGKRSIAQQLFEIFRSVRLRVPKRVFLSRWYPVDADGPELTKANLRLQAIGITLDALRAEGIDLALDDPGTEAGGTFLIHQEMYDALARNDIILVDLSGVRPNVCIEAGYALKHLQRGRLIFLFQQSEATPNNPQFDDPPFDLSPFRYEKIADSGEIRDKLKRHLEAIYRSAMSGP